MKLVITPTAQAQIDHQLGYGITRFGRATAEKTFATLHRFFTNVLAEFPRAGTHLTETDQYKTVVPRTPFVVIYRIEVEHDIVRILGLFHHAQDRSDFEAED